VGIRVSDLKAAREFYAGIVGLDEAFQIRDAKGTIEAIYFKVNDHQFVEIQPGLKTTDLAPLNHIAMHTGDVKKLHQLLRSKGLSPTEIKKNTRDGNLSFTLAGLPAQRLEFLEFLQYMPDSLHMKMKGKALSDRRLGEHIEHSGFVSTELDGALRFYVELLGFRERWRRRTPPDVGRVSLVHLSLPGSSGDYIECSIPGDPSKLTRQQASSSSHFSLRVPDVKVVRQLSIDRGLPPDRMSEPRFGLDERWQFNIFDPDGTRVEVMQPRDPAKAGTPVPNR
jgi:lactoylglutathione lyase